VFCLDPEIKRECIWNGPVLRPGALLCDRHNSIVRLRDDGTWSSPSPIRAYDSMLSEFADPQRAPEVLSLREQIRSWRFYDHFRTDAMAPARRGQVATRIEGDGSGRLDLRLRQRGLLRPLGVAELSDGTLRYLLWIAALLTPRPPGLLVLNEPETSLHPDLLAPLAQLISAAAASSQIIAVSHSRTLIDAMGSAARDGGIQASTIELAKDFGETHVVGQEMLDQPAWHWPKR
jgi:predicted ATPase